MLTKIEIDQINAPCLAKIKELETKVEEYKVLVNNHKTAAVNKVLSFNNLSAEHELLAQNIKDSNAKYRLLTDFLKDNYSMILPASLI